MRVLGIIVIILGLVGIVFGIMFFPQANSAQNEIAVQTAPIPLDQINEMFDKISAQYNSVMGAEGPAIAAQTALPSSTYAYLAGQRALLGLAKANMGTVQLVRYLGIVCIALGVGLAATGVVIYVKK